MGTINYGTSDYITMGFNLDVEPEYEEDNLFWAEEDFRVVGDIIKRYGFEYFTVTVEPGYYAGFYVDIKENYIKTYDWGKTECIDSYEERQAINREITAMREFLNELADMNMVSVYPGWCTGYADRKQTRTDINEAIREMREELKAIPTWSVVQRNKFQERR